MRPRGLMRIFTGVGALALALLPFGAEPLSGQVVSPIQPGHYVPGVFNVRDLVTPPPGLFVIWYNWTDKDNESSRQGYKSCMVSGWH